LKIFIDDDDDDDDDDDVVERTRTGPSAVRSDLEHQVNHNAKISNFYHVFSSYQEGGPTGAGKTRCLAVMMLSMLTNGTGTKNDPYISKRIIVIVIRLLMIMYHSIEE